MAGTNTARGHSVDLGKILIKNPHKGIENILNTTRTQTEATDKWIKIRWTTGFSSHWQYRC